MKAMHSIGAAAALTFVQPAQAAQTDPEVIIYRFPACAMMAAVSTSAWRRSFIARTSVARFSSVARPIGGFFNVR